MATKLGKFKELVKNMPMVSGLQYGYICTECPRKASVENQKLMDTIQLVHHFREHHNMSAEEEYEENWVNSKAYLIDRRPKAPPPTNTINLQRTNASVRRKRFREANNGCDPLRMHPITTRQDVTATTGAVDHGLMQYSMTMPEPNPLYQGHIHGSQSAVQQETWESQEPRRNRRENVFQPGPSLGTSYVNESFYAPAIHGPNFPLPVVPTLTSNASLENVVRSGLHAHSSRARASTSAPRIKKENSEENFRPTERRRQIRLEPLSRETHEELLMNGYFLDRNGEYKRVRYQNDSQQHY